MAVRNAIGRVRDATRSITVRPLPLETGPGPEGEEGPRRITMDAVETALEELLQVLADLRSISASGTDEA